MLPLTRTPTRTQMHVSKSNISHISNNPTFNSNRMPLPLPLPLPLPMPMPMPCQIKDLSHITHSNPNSNPFPTHSLMPLGLAPHACMHPCMHPWMHPCMHPCMHSPWPGPPCAAFGSPVLCYSQGLGIHSVRLHDFFFEYAVGPHRFRVGGQVPRGRARALPFHHCSHTARRRVSRRDASWREWGTSRRHPDAGHTVGASTAGAAPITLIRVAH